MERGDLEPSDNDSIKVRGVVGGRVGPERPKMESLKQERSSSFVLGAQRPSSTLLLLASAILWT